jgi:digeranylgeranylglycerophospholipid reductase
LNKQYDVIIVGGGPSGLSAASFLADKGFNVALFDMSEELGKDAVCSGVISVEAFKKYDLPINTIVANLRCADLVSPSGNIISYSHPEEAVVVVDRRRFDFELGVIAKSKGAEIFLGSRVRLVSCDKDNVRVEVLKDNELSYYRSRLLLLATGIKYNLHQSLGFKRPSKIMKGIQVEIDHVLNKRLEIYWGSKYSEGFFGWSIPLDNGKTRVGVMTDGNSESGLDNLLNDLGYNIKDNKNNKLNIQKRGITFGSFSKSFADRVLVLGEAAGFIKTTTGGGIYYGILSAEIASDVAAQCFSRNNFSSPVLSSYHNRCKNIFSNEIKFGRYFHSFFSRLSDELIDELFHAARKDDLLHYISNNGKFDWHGGTVSKILRSPNLRKILLNGFINNGLKLAI